jgi:hypothetical protein
VSAVESKATYITTRALACARQELGTVFVGCLGDRRRSPERGQILRDGGRADVDHPDLFDAVPGLVVVQLPFLVLARIARELASVYVHVRAYVRVNVYVLRVRVRTTRRK